MRKQDPESSRDRTRAQLVEVASELLATQGPDAVTTRSVALAAGVQAPTIHRLFGDKSGLLDAVAEHGFASYVACKPPVDAGADPAPRDRAPRRRPHPRGRRRRRLHPHRPALLSDWLDRIADAPVTSGGVR